MFRGRNLIIATRHGKEKVIAPVLEQALGLKCEVPAHLDTDLLGTFTGEVERKDDPLTTARNKCKMALEQYGGNLAIASEGSFGPHPEIMLIPANEEILVLVDMANDLEIIAREISTETNFNGRSIHSEQELLTFASQCLFPSHALIIRPEPRSPYGIVKGITDEAVLLQVFNNTMATHGKAHVETDMRAMYNPTRLKVIETTAKKLAEKMMSGCRVCGTPGFSVTEAVPGLPCSLCTSPTRSTLKHVLVCGKCGHTEERIFPYGKKTEDPMYCDYCNP